MTRKFQWNWQQKDWPNFTYDLEKISALEKEFIQKAGEAFGIIKHFSRTDKQDVTIQLISNEAFRTSEIEGEILDRESLQSSIKRHFGLKAPLTHNKPAEEGIAEMINDLYLHFEDPLTHETLWTWHTMLMSGRRDLHQIGIYRKNGDPMQVISGSIHHPTIHFEAPPADDVRKEMDHFINWFNKTSPEGKMPLPALTRSSIAHLYFESIHPFEDGNGRIGRALVEKILAQNIKHPTLIALSQIIHDNRKAYYDALEHQNKHNQVDYWLQYFSKTILKAQEYTINQMDFIIRKTKFFDKFKNQMNTRQHKVLVRMMREGINGFKGGLSAKNYMTITQTSASTATRDLQDLVEKKIFLQTGTRKSTRYWLNLV